MSTSRYRVLTGVQPAAIAVVAIAGPLVPPFLSRHFSRPANIGRLTHGDLTDETGETVDDALVARLSEHEAELSVHGGREVVRRVVEILRGYGFEEGNPARTIEDALPLCRTEIAVRVLLAQGKLEGQPWSDSPGLYWLLHPPRVAVVGLPNVGKSTLVNALCRRSASIVADLPGTTRDYVLAEADLGGLIVELVDTPGVRASTDVIEVGAIELARDVINAADARIIVLDSSRQVTTGEAEILAEHPDAILVANRADLANPAADLPPAAISTVATMGVEGRGIAALAARLRETFGVLPLPEMASLRMRWWREPQPVSQL